MVRHLWMSGVVMAFLSFGIKTGVGLAARILNRKASRGRAAAFFLLTFGAYLGLFAVLHLTVTRLNLLAYLDRIARLIQYGMTVHLAVALGLFFWGGRLLLSPDAGTCRGQRQETLGQLLLVMPCPVCATVILLNLTLALSLSDLPPLATTFRLFGLFWGIAGLTFLGLFLYHRGGVSRQNRCRPGKGFRQREGGLDNRFLGAAMILIALYFFGTVIIAPIYPKIGPAYAMAVSNAPTGGLDLNAFLTLGLICAILAGAGAARFHFKRGGNS